ncbi:nuclear transport factor 2 family protein [Streptomyces sp. NPDC004539]|uniref:nuclear transport factor 2 family protein n=1 Tax=Streptomyces sp. NPDC004539 TaxID=3154280 RepID=UPI0033A00323
MSALDRAAELRAVHARHEVINTLVRYLRAVDGQDLDGVLAELRYATVGFGGPEHHGTGELAALYRAAFASGSRTLHLLHEAEVELSAYGPGVVGRAVYQRWSLDTDPPAVTAFGRYHAVFTREGGQLRLLRLTVAREWQREG